MPINKNYNILFITDIHQNLKSLKNINFSAYDIIFCGGDILDPSNPDINIARSIIDLLPEKTFIVPGNCDNNESLIQYAKQKLIFIHKIETRFHDIPILGIGYSRNLESDMKIYRKYFLEDQKRIFDFHKNGKLAFMLEFCGIQIDKNNSINILSEKKAYELSKDFINKFKSFEEEEIKSLFSKITNLNGGIILTHSPPYEHLDKLDGLPNIGSLSLLEGIRKTKPRLVLCGHFHELYNSSNFDETTIFNPGAFKENRYGEIRLEDNKIQLFFRQL